jgi:predicted HTH transcriptional regulator
LANCLINADYYGDRGLVIRNHTDKIVLENPGGFRVGLDEAMSGGVSSPRNSVIMKMFNLLDIGERAGSGIPNIYRTWKEQSWDAPEYTEIFEPDRTVLTLSIKKVPIKNTDKKVPIKSTDKKPSARTMQQRETILEFIRENQIIKSVDLLSALDVKEERIKKLLQQLVTEGLVESIGSNRNRTYKLKGES